MNSPLVSIIIPCYNQAHFLKDAVRSVIEQTYSNWECIIVNDGSTDNTQELAKNLMNNDERIQYHNKDNGGLSSARNAGLDLSKGDFIQFLDADDCLEKTKLQKSVHEIINNQAIKIVVSNFKMFYKNILDIENPYCKISQQELDFKTLLNKWDTYFSIPIHCGFFDKTLFQNFRFPEHLKAKEDWIMWVTIFRNEPKSIFINEWLAFYRRNPASMTMTQDFSVDYYNSICFFKDILSNQEYEDFLISTIKNKYLESNKYKARFIEAINSKSYIIGKFLKKILKKMGMLRFMTKIIETLFYPVLKK